MNALLSEGSAQAGCPLRHQSPSLTATARQDQGQTLGDVQGLEIPLLPHGEETCEFFVWRCWCGSTRELGSGGRGFEGPLKLYQDRGRHLLGEGCMGLWELQGIYLHIHRLKP